VNDVLTRLTAALAGRYRVERELGAGGMATVYLAHDLRHDRDVAIKVLHPDLGAALGGERFLAEIKTTAKLQHPHILPLLDSGEADGLLYYVMPYVRGETLRARLEREKQLPIADAVRIAREVAGALEHAHTQGVIHRDIKPENILLQDGGALVADFGIALAVQTAGGARMTQTGLSLGTPSYMSPEQAMGERTIDARSDIYALGAVTYEMLTGDAPFSGSSVQAIVARVLAERPGSMRAVRETVPEHVEVAVMTALAKLPADRQSSAARFAEALNSGEAGGRSAAKPPIGQRRPAIQAMGVLLGAVLGVGGTWVWATQATVPGRAASAILAQLLPRAGELWSSGGNDVAISPDGGRVALIARTQDWNGVLVRSLDSLGSRYLARTAGARAPFWSPDGTRIGFFADRQLKVVELATGTVRVLCSSPISSNRGSWGANDVILYVPEFDGIVHRTSSRGSGCTPLGVRVSADSARQSQVEFLPDGEHFLLVNSNFAWIGKVGDSTVTFLRETQLRRTVPATDDFVLLSLPGTNVNTVFAQQIDPNARKLIGEAVPFFDDVINPGGRSPISVARNGTAVLRVNPRALGYEEANVRFARFSADGRFLDTLEAIDTFGRFRVRNTGDIVQGGFHTARWDPASRGWTDIIPRASQPRTVLNPVWSPGDSMLAVARAGMRGDSIVIVRVRTGEERTVAGAANRYRRMELTEWTPDGRYILFESSAGNANPPSEPWMADVATGQVRRIFDDPTDIFDMRVSPNGRWIAYESLAGGVTDVFLRPFPGPGVPVRVTTGGGASPRWRGNGELLVASARRVEAIAIDGQGGPGSRRPVVSEAAISGLNATGEVELEVSPDGQTVVLRVSGQVAPPLLVLSDWRMRRTR